MELLISFFEKKKYSPTADFTFLQKNWQYFQSYRLNFKSQEKNNNHLKNKLVQVVY